jgi:hypothetical protein
MDTDSNSTTRRGGRLKRWILLIACLLLLSLGATPYHKIADTTLIAVRLSLVIVLSVLVIRERWSSRHDLEGGAYARRNSKETILQRMRRWYYDEQLHR